MTLSEVNLKRKRDEESIRISLENKGFKRGFEIGFEIGFEEGYKEEIEKMSRAVAIKLKAIGMALENISEVTGLSIEEIESL